MWGSIVSKAHKGKGFTLIEMMLVAVLLGIVGLAIVATFAGGMKLFHRAESYTAAKADVLLAMEKMERDLRNTFALKGIDFIGEAHRMTFSAILDTASAEDRAGGSLGSVAYFRDDGFSKGALSREEKPYAQAVQKEDLEHGDITALAPIEEINFQYFYFDPEAGTYSWVNSWDRSEAREAREKGSPFAKGVTGSENRQEDIPLGVKIKIKFTDGGRMFTMNRTVFIKTAVSLNAAMRRTKAEKNDPKEAPGE
jgi:prepilin-type N-terminal cleavage/methylation domain-containing protein